MTSRRIILVLTLLFVVGGFVGLVLNIAALF